MGGRRIRASKSDQQRKRISPPMMQPPSFQQRFMPQIGLEIIPTMPIKPEIRPGPVLYAM